jgi:hypothetical protein
VRSAARSRSAAFVLSAALVCGSVAVAACSDAHRCDLQATAVIDLAKDSGGAATPQAAIEQFVGSGNSIGRTLPRDGWRSSGGLTYRSGSSTITITRLADGTYAVTGVHSC